MAKSVCKIRILTNRGIYITGTGFFLKFFINEILYHWLVTNEHVITKEMINNKKEINDSFNIERKNINLKLDTKERYIKTFKDFNVYATAIQIRSHDRVYEDYFLEPELGYDNNNLVGKEIFIPQFPGVQSIQNSRGIISKTSDGSPEFAHKAKTLKGSSGSPIFLKGSNKVIGIHKEGATLVRENYGDFIEPIINILDDDIKAIFKRMQTHNDNQNNGNISIKSHHSFGKVSEHSGFSEILVKPGNPINITGQIKQDNPNSINQINQNVMEDNKVIPGNLNNFNAINGSNNKPNNMNNKINNISNKMNNSINKINNNNINKDINNYNKINNNINNNNNDINNNNNNINNISINNNKINNNNFNIALIKI